MRYSHFDSPTSAKKAPQVKFRSEACQVLVRGADGTKQPCGLPAHYIVGNVRFCGEKHKALAYTTAKKSRKGYVGLTPREQMILAACN